MASNSTFQVAFKITDENGMKKLIVDAKDLTNVFRKAAEEAQNLQARAINFAAFATGIDSVNSMLSSLQGVLIELAGAYSDQIEAETKLAINMRNSMDAREEDIQSIKDLCSAQQKLGVIGDEVQLAGAQEMATYLGEKESLEQLIPVMNDMIAQQYGLNATQDSAVNIATMLGKVMDGQVGALSRYGYSFDEAQEKVLKYGTEAQRVAVLTEVVESAVGGMNEALAQTPAGSLKQTENAVGDIKERIGEALIPIETYGKYIIEMTQGAANILKVGRTVVEVNKSVNAITESLTHVIKKQIQAWRIYANAAKGSAAASKAAGVAMRGLGMATGIGIAITGLTWALTELCSKEKEASQSVKALTDAEDAYKSSAAEALSEIRGEASSLNELISANKDTTAAVDELNRKYGETFGVHKAAAEWYDILTTKSLAYAKAKGYEAQMAKVAADMAELAIKKEMAQEKMREMEKDGTAKATYMVSGGGQFGGAVYAEGESREYKKLKKEIGEYEDALKPLEEQLSIIDNLSKQTKESLGEITPIIEPEKDDNSKKSKPEEVVPEGSIKDLQKQLSEKKNEFDLAISDQSRREIAQDIAEIELQIQRIQDNASRKSIGAVDIKKVLPSTDAIMDSIEIPDMPELDLTSTFDGMKGKAQEVVQYYDDMAASMQRVAEEQKALGAINSIMDDMSGIVGESAGAWLSYMGNVVGAVQQALPAISSLIAALTAKAAGEAMAENAAMGPFGWISGVAAISGVIAAMATLPKFADGGIVSGPTVGLIGEYAGASNNPEVVAPLDKLRSLIEPRGELAGRVEFEIDGRKLKGVLNKVDHLSNRS